MPGTTEASLGKLRVGTGLWGKLEEKAGFGPQIDLVGFGDRQNAKAKMLRSEWT